MSELMSNALCGKNGEYPFHPRRKNVPFSLFFNGAFIWFFGGVAIVPYTPVALANDNRHPTLEFGQYPHINDLESNEISEDSSIRGDVSSITRQVGKTVKKVTSHRNSTCWGSPCLVQAVPIIYTKAELGFYGGAYVNVSNPHPKPYLYSWSNRIVRADNSDYRLDSQLDIPQFRFLGWTWRLKTFATARNTRDNLYFGNGPASLASDGLASAKVNYVDQERGVGSNILLSIRDFAREGSNPQKLSLILMGSSYHHRPAAIGGSQSPLFQDRPIGVDGGFSTVFGFGAALDSRDQERLTTTGSTTEVSWVAGGGLWGNFSFDRVTFIDRRYFSARRLILAHRFTGDALLGQAPFWEHTGVGGIDPMKEVCSVQLLKGCRGGRFHETSKAIESLELRWNLNAIRPFGVYTDWEWQIVGANFARLGNLNYWDISTGLNLLFQKVLYMKVSVAYGLGATEYKVGFGSQF